MNIHNPKVIITYFIEICGSILMPAPTFPPVINNVITCSTTTPNMHPNNPPITPYPKLSKLSTLYNIFLLAPTLLNVPSTGIFSIIITLKDEKMINILISITITLIIISGCAIHDTCSLNISSDIVSSASS